MDINNDSIRECSVPSSSSEEILAYPVFDSEARDRARSLLTRIYASHGLSSDLNRFETSAELEFPDRFTLLAEDERGLPMATISLTFDVNGQLPCEEIFGLEMQRLRHSRRRMCEVTGLAIRGSVAHPKIVLVRLFNLIYVYARKLKNCDDFLIEVHPKHVAYYTRLLGFKPWGPSRPCPRVGHAPAVLLRLDLSHSEKQISAWAGMDVSTKGAKARFSLYPYFLPANKEAVARRELERQVSEFHAHALVGTGV